MSTKMRLRYLVNEIDVRAGRASASLPLLSVSIHHGVVPRAEMTDRESRADDFAAYKRVAAGDIVINRMRAFEGGAGISDRDGMVSADYAVLRPGPQLYGPFFHHLIRSAWFVGEMTSRLRGIGNVEQGNVRTPRINVEDLGEITVALPPVSRQRALADYLDTETARIEGLVRRRTSIIELMAERRRLATDEAMSELSHAGLWPQVKMKHLVRGFVDTLHATAPSEDDGPGYIVGTACIKGGALDLSSARRCSFSTFREWTKRAIPRAGDVLLTREAPAGEAALVPEGIPVAPGQRVVLIQTDQGRMLPELVLYSVYSARAARFFELLGRETTVAHLNLADIGELPVVVPPLDLQPTLASRIREAMNAIDRLTTAMVSQIDLLLERRQALITAAVTGQLDIPGAA